MILSYLLTKILWSGCSSLEGFFQENGLIQWSWGQYSPQINQYSWVNLTNMLWVEYPVGVGFSPGEPTATNEEDPAEEFIQFFQNFQVQSPIHPWTLISF